MKSNFDDVYYPDNLNEILYKNVDEKMIDHIRRANKDNLSDVAQTLFSVSVTYKELFDNIERYAKSLKKYGIQKGDCVTLAMPNIPETIYYIYACNEIGATAYPIDPRCTFESMVNCINNSKSKLFICEMGTYYTKVAKNINLLPIDNVVVVSPVNMFDNVKKIPSKANIAKYLYHTKRILEEMKLLFKNNNKKIFQKDFIKNGSNYIGNYSSEYNPEIPSIIVNTSGTTGGSVKGAVHSDKSYNIYTNQISLITNALQRGNTYYGYVPYFSMYGSAVGMHTALTHGIIINNIPKFNGRKSLQEIIDSKSNILIAVPNMIDKLTKMYDVENVDASHVKQYVIGGDNVDPDTLIHENNILESRGMKNKIIFGYGATEVFPIATTSFDERSQIYGATGVPYPGVDIKILNPQTLEELESNVEGEIYVHTPNMMYGYLNMPRDNKIVFKNIDGTKFFKTGDKGYLTEDGVLFITGRYKRMMKRPDGHQTSPIPIENAICMNDNVDNCSVVGIKKDCNIPGVIPTAFVILKNKNVDIKEEIRNIAEKALSQLSGEREAALAYVIVDNLPYTINGKLDFEKLSQYKFDDLNYYVIEDPVTKEYFSNDYNINFIKINVASKVKSLKK